jgi:hypothetical protein
MFGQNFAVCRPAILLVGFVSYPSHITFAWPAFLTATEPLRLFNNVLCNLNVLRGKRRKWRAAETSPGR